MMEHTNIMESSINYGGKDTINKPLGTDYTKPFAKMLMEKYRKDAKPCYLSEKITPKSSVIPIVKPLLVERVEKIEDKYDVWCISVPTARHFSLSNGAIVHNSDAMRYLAITLPKLRDGLTQEDIDRKYKEKLYGADLPKEFIQPNERFRGF